jgi:hypothetical protein
MACRANFLRKFMLLLDANVYLSCGAWVYAADSILAFVDALFDRLDFEVIIELISSAFYKGLVARYFNTNSKGVYIPGYALKHVEDLHTRLPRVQHSDKFDNLNEMPVQTIECPHTPFEPYVTKGGVMTKALEMGLLLVRVLSEDEQQHNYEEIFFRVADMESVLKVNDPNIPKWDILAKVHNSLLVSYHQKAYQRNLQRRSDVRRGLPETFFKALCVIHQLGSAFEDTHAGYLTHSMVCLKFSGQAHDKEIKKKVEAAINVAFDAEPRSQSKHIYLQRLLMRKWNSKI